MKKRPAEILQRLIEAPSHRLRLSALVDGYRISDKTLRADIATAASFAADPRGTSMLKVTDHHVSLVEGADITGLQELLRTMDLYEYRLSFDERKRLIACMLLMLDEGSWCSMQQLADAMYVTRNTVISDMKAVDEYLASYGIPLVSKSKRGMRVEATAGQVRELLVDLFAAVLNERSCRRDYYSSLVVCALGGTAELDDVVDATRAFLKSRNIFLSVGVENEIEACLMTMLGNVAARYGDAAMLAALEGGNADAVLRSPRPLDVIGELVQYVCGRLGLGQLDAARIALIEQLILGRNLFPHIKKFDDFDLYCAVTHFLLLVGRRLDMDIQNDDLLVESLLSHLKSVMSWSSDSFEVNVSGPSGAMVSMVQAAAAPHFEVLEDCLRRPLDTSMRASVVIHICAALYRSESDRRPCRVYVACPSSVATSKYLEAQVRNYFKLDVLGAVATSAIEAGDVSLEGIDFVVSTVPIAEAGVPVVVVSPVLSVDDINKIQACAFRQSGTDASAETQDESALMDKLQDVFAHGSKRKKALLAHLWQEALEKVDRIELETAHMSPLLRMLERRFIRVEEGRLPWRRAMRLAAGSLMEEGYFDKRYVDVAIDHVEEYGTYIIVNQGIALAHAGKEDGVHRDGLSLLVSREGVEFDEGERVHLLFFFSQVSDTDYLDLFREVISLGNDASGMERICAASSADEAYRIMIEMLSDYALDA